MAKKKKRAPGGGRKNKFIEATETISIRVPKSQKKRLLALIRREIEPFKAKISG